MPRILLVEDEESLRSAIQLNLELDEHEVVAISDGSKAMDIVSGQHFDLIVLDIMLPGLDGFQICEQIRLRDAETPIIFLTAKNTSQDRIQGLKLGADDYLTKPFVLEEFMLRVQNLLKRTNKETAEALHHFAFGTNQINFATHEAETPNGKIQLTKKETLLLKLLVERKNEVVSRQQILQSVWGYDVFPSTRTIDNFILSFRKYFEADPKNPAYFQSVRGIGYKFVLV